MFNGMKVAGFCCKGEAVCGKIILEQHGLS
jgi:hypothetical protein